MKALVRTIKLSYGDVRELRVYRHKHATRILIYDDDLAVPLIQARLTAAEIEAMRKVLDTRK